MIKIELEIFHKLQQNLEIERAENERMCKENAYLREQIACACNALRDSFLCCGNRIKDNIGWVRKLEAVLIASNEDIDRHTMLRAHAQTITNEIYKREEMEAIVPDEEVKP